MTQSSKSISIVKPAPLVKRAIAFLMDGVVIFFVAALIVSKLIVPFGHAEAMFYLKSILSNFNDASSLPDILDQINGVQEIRNMLFAIDSALFFITWTYFAINEVALNGSSIGKRVFNIGVVRINELRPQNVVEVIFRSGVFSIFLFSLWPVFIVVNCIFAAFSKMNRSLVDIISKTLVSDAKTIAQSPTQD